MKKRDVLFVCDSCGNEYPRWMGKCEACGEWNTFREVSKKDLEATREVENQNEQGEAKLTKLSEGNFEGKRVISGLEEWDRVVGGGLVEGSLILIGGEPGIGKSTLMLQICNCLAKKQEKVLYTSGEESLTQVGGRAKRLNLLTDEIDFIETSSLETIIKVVKQNDYKFVVIDSIQTLTSGMIGGGLGSIVQVRYCAAKIMELAKANNISILLVGHVTKEGEVAGPRILEHLVDAVLYFEGERSGDLRVLRVLKNRFGATDETGVFVMTEGGLSSVADISKMFIQGRRSGITGSAIGVAMEGTRPFVVEIQAIADKTVYGLPKRTGLGIDLNRLNMILAVIGKRGGINVYDKDIYANVVGGFRLNDRSTDLGFVLAITSVIIGKSVPGQVAVIGEIGLLGEIRMVKGIDKRIREAIGMGFTRVFGPKVKNKIDKYIEVETINELFKQIFG